MILDAEKTNELKELLDEISDINFYFATKVHKIGTFFWMNKTDDGITLIEGNNSLLEELCCEINKSTLPDNTKHKLLIKLDRFVI